MPVKFEIDELRLISASYSMTDSELENGDEDLDDETIQPIELSIKISHKYRKDHKRLLVILKLVSIDKALPFTFDIEYGGAFIITQDADVIEYDELDRLAKIYCAAIIYPYAREFISELVKRGGDAPFYLPILNFVELYRTEMKKKRKELKSSNA